LAQKAAPVAINETIWGLGMSAYLMAIGYISAGAIETVQISNQIMGLFWVANAGISTACAIMLGNKLGENQIELAKKWGKQFVKLSFFAGVILGVILFATSGLIASAFENVSDTVQTDVKLTLMIFSFYVPIKFSNALQIIGTLRAGGDTKYAMIAELIPLWGIGVPLAFILSIFTELPVYVIMGLVNIEEIIKLVLVFKRYKSNIWAKNLTIEH
jgi:Na+-driven multidrug efflux pump